VPGVRQGLQPELQPDNAFPQAHRLQALLLQAVPQGLPAEGGPAAAQGDPAHGPPCPPGQGGLHVGGGGSGGLCRAGRVNASRSFHGESGSQCGQLGEHERRSSSDGQPELPEGFAAGIT